MHFVDREAKYPNRWTMKKSDGTSEVVTLVRNDEPIVEGTPMNAETLNSLSDVAGANIAKEEAIRQANNAASSASAAFASEKRSLEHALKASDSQALAKESQEKAEAAAELAGTRANTDKTLSVSDAPADAKIVGEKINKKADKANFMNALIEKSAWELDQNPIYPAWCDVPAKGVTENDVVCVQLYNSNYNVDVIGNSCVSNICNSGTNKITLRAKHIPEGTITVTYYIIQ